MSARKPLPPVEQSLDDEFFSRRCAWEGAARRMDAKMTARLIPAGTRVFVLGLGWGVALEDWGQVGTPTPEPAQMVQLDGVLGLVPVLLGTMIPADAVAGRDPASLSPFGGAA